MSSKHAVPAVWFPNQRVIRTAIQAVIGAIPTVVAIVGIVHAQWPTGWLAAALAAGVAVQSVAARIMALPAVNAWLTGVGAGTVPASELAEVVDLNRTTNADTQARIARLTR